jgi:Putative transposase/Transposase zinc-binding domain
MSLSIKQILLSNQNWWRFYSKYSHRIRSSIVIAITKLLSCKNVIRGYRHYRCSNPDCSHTKKVFHTCKSRACSSCGKKATEIWINKQARLLPKTSWQHITFTMPSELWDFFWYNRSLLNHIGLIAAHAVQTLAKNVTPAIFIAIHTFGRDLKRNVHVHLSTTAGGLSADLLSWKKLFFHQPTLMKIWRHGIISLLRSEKLTIPPERDQQLNHTFNFNHFLDRLYKKTWIVHCAPPSQEYEAILAYLGRYIKRPPIAASKLKHYDGNDVTFRYLDHTSSSWRNLSLSVEDFIARFIQHIPDTGFRMIRYYGILSHRLRGKLLPLAHALLEQGQSPPPDPLSFDQLIEKDFGFNPLTCILCNSPLHLYVIFFGKTDVLSLLENHQKLALLRRI